MSENWGGAGGGGFLRILGIIYLIKAIRHRREHRRERRQDDQAQARSHDDLFAQVKRYRFCEPCSRLSPAGSIAAGWRGGYSRR